MLVSVSSETPPSTGSLIAFPRARLPPAVTELQAKNSPPTTSSDARRPLLRRLRARGLQSTVGKNAQTLVYKRQGVLKLVCEISASQNNFSRATLRTIHAPTRENTSARPSRSTFPVLKTSITSPIGQGCLGVAAVTPNRLAKREAGRGVAPGAAAKSTARRPHARGTGTNKRSKKSEEDRREKGEI